MLESLFGGLALWGPVFLRLGAGITFIVHGYPKLFGDTPGPKKFAQYLHGLGFQPPLFWAYLVGIVEFFGGIGLIIGFLTRLVALLLTIEFLVIVLRIKWSKGFKLEQGGWEWDWALLTIVAALLVMGPGRAALDHAIRTGL